MQCITIHVFPNLAELEHCPNVPLIYRCFMFKISGNSWISMTFLNVSVYSKIKLHECFKALHEVGKRTDGTAECSHRC